MESNWNELFRDLDYDLENMYAHFWGRNPQSYQQFNIFRTISRLRE